jgi:hypothetical protein
MDLESILVGLQSLRCYYGICLVRSVYSGLQETATEYVYRTWTRLNDLTA